MPQTTKNIILIIVSLAAGLNFLFTGNMLGLALTVLLPLGLMSLSNPGVMAVLSIAFFCSWIKIPFAPGVRQMYELFMGMTFISCLLHIFTGRRPWRMTFLNICVTVFVGILGFLMYYRGFGFQSTGGSTWGGGMYLVLIPCALFFIASMSLRLTLIQWRTAISMMCIFSILPAIAEITGMLTGSARPFLNAIFINPQASSISFEEVRNNLDFSYRFKGFMPAYSVFLLPFALLPFSSRSFLAHLAFITLSLIFAALTGHRLLIITILLFTWSFFFFKASNKLTYMIKSSAALGFCWMLLAFSAHLLPLNAQRALSFVPGTGISHRMTDDARATSDWRVQVWKAAIKDIPEYVIIGKGFSYDAETFISIMRGSRVSQSDNIQWALFSGAYHQGILSLLICMGLPGLAAGVAFIFGILIRHWRVAHSQWQNAEEQRIHSALYIMFAVLSFNYVAIYGDVPVSFPTLFFYGGLLELLLNSKDKPQEDAAQIIQ